jgi:hypothetical protein
MWGVQGLISKEFGVGIETDKNKNDRKDLQESTRLAAVKKTKVFSEIM